MTSVTLSSWRSGHTGPRKFLIEFSKTVTLSGFPSGLAITLLFLFFGSGHAVFSPAGEDHEFALSRSFGAYKFKYAFFLRPDRERLNFAVKCGVMLAE